MFITTHLRSEGMEMAINRRQTQEKRTEPSRSQVIRIDVLPDDALLEIFDSYVGSLYEGTGRREIEAWQSLVHVCRRWRSLVFQSPRRLNLHLYCTPKTPAKDILDIWPALPLVVNGNGNTLSSGTNNTIAALGQNNRVRQVNLWDLADWQLEEVLASMQVPFPELTALRLWSERKWPPFNSDIPDSFLDGSAPRLHFLNLSGIPFPGLPKLLLSATHLVCLDLVDIPYSGYISPEAMVALLPVLSSLKTLILKFRSPQSPPHRETRRPPPSKHYVIPALTHFLFKGVTEYLEEFVTFIDTPQLNILHTTFFYQNGFDAPRLTQFVNRTPTLTAHDRAHVKFDDLKTSVALLARSSVNLRVGISCQEPDLQLSSITQVCNSSLRTLSMVEDLYIAHRYSELVWRNDAVENTLWLELFLPFTAVKNLYLSEEFAPGIAVALQELVGGRITEVLPSLQNIFVGGLERSGSLQENFGQFAAARQYSGHPIAISVWDKDSETESM